MYTYGKFSCKNFTDVCPVFRLLYAIIHGVRFLVDTVYGYAFAGDFRKILPFRIISNFGITIICTNSDDKMLRQNNETRNTRYVTLKATQHQKQCFSLILALST